MNVLSFQSQKGSLWGWCALGLCLPIYILILCIKFQWIVTSSEVAFLLYTGYILAGVGLPILILIQGIRLVRLWISKIPINRQEFILFFLSSVLYGLALWLGANLKS